MGCFLVPAAEAVVTTIITGSLKKKEEKAALAAEALQLPEREHKLPFSVKMGWLNKLLWGGSALLAFEHLWHGEISPAFPFLTAVEEGTLPELLREMATAGVGMAVLITAVWGGMLAVSAVLEKKSAAVEKEA